MTDETLGKGAAGGLRIFKSSLSDTDLEHKIVERAVQQLKSETSIKGRSKPASSSIKQHALKLK